MKTLPWRIPWLEIGTVEDFPAATWREIGTVEDFPAAAGSRTAFVRT